MEYVKFLFLLIEFVVVINSSYVSSLRSLRFRPSSAIPRQCETPILKNGSVRLRQRGRLIRYLCAPSFTLIGDKYSSCVQGQWETPVPMCIKPGCPVVVPPEHGFTVPDRNGALTMLFCKPGYSLAGSQETFCDGTVWDRSLGSCRETQTSPVMSCDFEVSSICDWVADPTHDFEWIRKNGYTSLKQLQTGPAHDHTVGIPLEGHFMLATFANQLPSSVARLISPLYPANASQNACFSLYYHMYGATTGVLRVYVKPESVAIADILDSPKYLFMEKLGTFQNAWMESVFNIDQYDEDFQIVIEATATRTTRSNIAIDDVALLSDADCLNEERKSTAVTPEEGGVFDAQSCVSRCQETAPYSPNVTEEVKTSSNETVILLHCDCFDGCEDLKTCCLDYRSVCVFDVSTVESTDLEVNSVTEITSNITLSIPSTSTSASTPSVLPTSASTSTSIATSTSISTSTSTATSTSTSTTTTRTTPTTVKITTRKTVPTTKMISSTKGIPLIPSTSTQITPIKTTSLSTPSTKISTTVKTTLKPSTKYVTPQKRVTTVSPSTTTKVAKPLPTTKRTTPAIPTTKRTTPAIRAISTTLTLATSRAVTSPIPVTNNTSKNANLRDDEWHPVDNPTDTDPLPRNLLIVFGIMVIIVAISIVTFKLFRKYQIDRYIYNRKSKRYSEDASDEVRFLTADEQLDFTMQTEDSFKKC